MPTIDEHLNQYQENKTFLDKLVQGSDPEYNWIITVSFYAALHLVEKELVSLGSASGNHSERNKSVNNLLKPIRKVYKQLYWKSRESRYDCFTMSEQDSRWALAKLKEIEQHISA